MWAVLPQHDPDLRERIYSQDYSSTGPTAYRRPHMKLLTFLLHQYNVTNDQSLRGSRNSGDVVIHPAETNLLRFSGAPSEDRMSTSEPFSNSIYEEQMHLAECEFSAFICAVTELYGPEWDRSLRYQGIGNTNVQLFRFGASV